MVLRDGVQRKFLIGVRVQDQYFIGVGILSQNFRAYCVLRDPYFTPVFLRKNRRDEFIASSKREAIAYL